MSMQCALSSTCHPDRGLQPERRDLRFAGSGTKHLGFRISAYSTSQWFRLRPTLAKSGQARLLRLIEIHIVSFRCGRTAGPSARAEALGRDDKLGTVGGDGRVKRTKSAVCVTCGQPLLIIPPTLPAPGAPAPVVRGDRRCDRRSAAPRATGFGRSRAGRGANRSCLGSLISWRMASRFP